MDYPIWETMIIVIDKAQRHQGFGIGISGGIDIPNLKTGSTAIIVSYIVPGSPSDGLLKMHDEILFINNNNMTRVTHDDAVHALTEAGMRARMVIRRIKPASSIKSSVPKDIAYDNNNEASIVWLSKPVLTQRRTSTAAEQQLQKPEFKVEMNGFSQVLALDAGDNANRVTLKRNRDYGFPIGELFYDRELAPNGPTLNFGGSQQGHRVLEINSTPLDQIKTLSEAINLILGVTTQISFLLEKNEFKGSKPYVEDSESLLSGKALVEPDTESPNTKYQINATWRSPHRRTAQSPEEAYDTNKLRDARPNKERMHATAEPVLETNARLHAHSISLEKQQIDQRKSQRRNTNHEGRCVTFQKRGDAGIQIAGGNAVGIFIAAVHQESAAAKAGLEKGDQILEANEIDFRQITREEAVLNLVALDEKVSLFVVSKKAEFERIKSQPGDNFFIRTNFEHGRISNNNELMFHKGDIFNVRDTLYQGRDGVWWAKGIDKNGQLLKKGVLPSKSRAEQLAIAQAREERMDDLDVCSLQRSDFMFKRKVGYDENEFEYVCIVPHFQTVPLDIDDVQIKIPAYERVVLRVANYMRPVAIFGPCADLAKMLLVEDMPHQFAFSLPTNKFGCEVRAKPKYRDKYEPYAPPVKLSRIREIVREKKHCLLNLTPDDIEDLIKFQMCPIVILLRTVSYFAVKELRASLVGQLKRKWYSSIKLTKDPLTRKQVKKLYSLTKVLEESYPNFFTAKLDTHFVGSAPDTRMWYEKMKEIIFRQQSEMVWMPEESYPDVVWPIV